MPFAPTQQVSRRDVQRFRGERWPWSRAVGTALGGQKLLLLHFEFLFRK
jgi:hypothetical protein